LINRLQLATGNWQLATGNWQLATCQYHQHFDRQFVQRRGERGSEQWPLLTRIFIIA
jgi:hypothetical protein